jgi:hypothetical protein
MDWRVDQPYVCTENVDVLLTAIDNLASSCLPNVIEHEMDCDVTDTQLIEACEQYEHEGNYCSNVLL